MGLALATVALTLMPLLPSSHPPAAPSKAPYPLGGDSAPKDPLLGWLMAARAAEVPAGVGMSAACLDSHRTIHGHGLKQTGWAVVAAMAACKTRHEEEVDF